MTTQQNDFLAPQKSENDEIDIKKILFLLLKKWYLIVPGLILGLAGAYLVNKFTPTTYGVNTTVLVEQDNNSMSMSDIFTDNNLFSGLSTPSLNNEVQLLRSFTLNQQALENLNWQVAWEEKNLIVWNGLYLNEPFLLSKNDAYLNPTGIHIEIRPLSEKNYAIKAQGISRQDGEELEIDLEAVGEFNQEFTSKYFGFTLQPRGTIEDVLGHQYRFHFIDRTRLTHSYLKRLSIEADEKQGDYITLSLESSEALRDIHFLNELVRMYSELKLELQTRTFKRSIEFIDAQISGISDTLSEAESNYTRFRAQNQIIDLSNQGSIIMEQLKELESERSNLQMQQDYFMNLQNYLRNEQSSDQPVVPSVMGITDATLNSLVVKLSDLYSRRKVLAYSAKENNPTLIMINGEITQIREQLSEVLVNLIDNTSVSLESLNKRYHTINRQLNNLPEQEQQLVNIERQYELTNDIYTFLLERRSELEIALAGAVVNIHIIDPAQLERLVPQRKSLVILLLIGAILGMAVPIGLILLFSFFDNTIQLQEDVEKLTRLSILGNVLHSSHPQELAVLNAPASPLAESYRTIRTNLQFKLVDGQKVIGIHSIIPGEGKTFTATNLASILAMNDKKTVLVGADMRKPRLHRILDVAKGPGLSSYLAGQALLPDVIVPTKIDNLYIVPSGPIPPNPAELLERKEFAILMDHLRENFDYIVIDNAPVSMVADALITGRQSDINLFVLRYKVSKKEELQYLNELAASGVIQSPTLMVNDVKIDFAGYSGAYQYKYGYKYGYAQGYK